MPWTLWLLLLLIVSTSLCRAEEVPLTNKQVEFEQILQKVYAAERVRFERQRDADREYRTACSALLSKADRVEIYLLDPEYDGLAELNPEEIFRIEHSKEKWRILKVFVVPDGPEESELIASMTAVLTDVEPGGFNLLPHVPFYGVKFYMGETRIFESSIGTVDYEWVFAFASKSESRDFGWKGVALGKLLERLMPSEALQKFKADIKAQSEKRKALPDNVRQPN